MKPDGKIKFSKLQKENFKIRSNTCLVQCLLPFTLYIMCHPVNLAGVIFCEVRFKSRVLLSQQMFTEHLLSAEHWARFWNVRVTKTENSRYVFIYTIMIMVFIEFNIVKIIQIFR